MSYARYGENWKEQLISLLLHAETYYLGKSLEGTGLWVPEDPHCHLIPSQVGSFLDNFVKG